MELADKLDYPCALIRVLSVIQCPRGRAGSIPAAGISFHGGLTLKKNLRIDLGHVDYDALETDADFESVANRVLPKALVQIGEATAETAWTELQKGLKKSGLKPNSSTSEKRKFIREGGQNFKRSASAKDKREIKATIISQLRDQKASRG